MKRVIYKPTDKAKLVWRERKKSRIRFLEGAVRSGKSYTANDIAIHEIQRLPACDILVSGYSITSVARNVIAEWKKAIDPFNKGLFRMVRDGKDEYMKIDWRGLRNKKFYIRGAGKENDWMQIQGATFGYWLADELTRHCESFIDMALSRLSMDDAQAIWTTNPDHPLHFVKKRFIDDLELYKQNDDGTAEIARYTFYLTDNPSLSKPYIRSLQKLYRGVFADRFLRSKWVMAEGAIYDFFDTKANTVVYFRGALQRYICLDYGTRNPTCFLEFGRNDLHAKGEPRVWSEREYYWDSIEEGRQKDDAEYAKDFVRFIGHGEYDCTIYDPSAASLILAIKNELNRCKKFMVFRPANNAVLDGIKTQQRMLASGEYKVGANCKQTIMDYGAYIWDKKKSERGEDAPVKDNDHTKDVERYLLHTLFGGSGIDYLNALS